MQSTTSATIRGWAVVCTLAVSLVSTVRAESPASAPSGAPFPQSNPTSAATATPDPDVTALVGLAFKDAAIATALQTFADGKVDEAIDGLFKIINDRAQKDAERKRELQLTVAMLQIRSGDHKNAKTGQTNFSRGRGSAIEYTKSWSEKQIGVRAAVIRMAADKAVNDGTATFEKLGPHEKWLECLRHVAIDLETRVRDEDKKLARSITASTLPNAEDILKKLAKYVEQRDAIQLDREKLDTAMDAHGRELDAAARKLNDVLGELIAHADSLKRDWERAGLRTRSTARDKANVAVKAAEQCRGVLDLALETQRELCRRFPDTCVRSTVLPRTVPARVP